MTTAGDQINGALKLLGVLAEGETPLYEMSNDALIALNQMLDSWSIEELAVYATQDQIKTWTPGSIYQTLGPSGTIIGNRPIQLQDSTYFRDAATNISYGIKLINQQQYDGIAVKTVTSSYPQVMFINYDYPDVTMFIYPVPTIALEMHFISAEPLAQPATLATTLSFPPGYMRAFKFNLACEIAADFGIEAPVSVQRIAMASKRDIKRINNPGDVMAMPYSLLGNRQRYNVFSGNY